MSGKKESPTPFSQQDLEAFVETRSDFAFEMEALRALHGAGYACQHAATFVDPITKKIRQFDIRARRQIDDFAVRLAVECKHLTLDSPIVAYRTPRGPPEAYHSLVVRRRDGLHFSSAARISPSAHYRVERPVARQLDQPVKKGASSFQNAESATFEKWSQALSGVSDEVRKAVTESVASSAVLSILPVLVVPDGTLWCVDYDRNGEITTSIRQVSSCQLFVGHTWTVPAEISPVDFGISHLEIVTLSELRHWAVSILVDGKMFDKAEQLLA